MLIYTEIWPPFNYLDDNGKIVGAATDVVRALMNEANVQYSIEIMPWSRAFAKIQGQPNSLIYSIYYTDERAPLFHWLCPMFHSKGVGLFKLRSRKDLQLVSLDDAKSYLIGTIRGGFSREYLIAQGFSEQTNLLISSDEEANVRQLFSRRVDLIIQSPESIAYRLKKMGVATDQIEPVLNSFDNQERQICLAINRESDPILIATLERAFNKIMRDRNTRLIPSLP